MFDSTTVLSGATHYSRAQHNVLSLVLALAFIVAMGHGMRAHASEARADIPSGRAQATDSLSERIFVLVNEFRKEQGRVAMKRDARLTEAAEHFAAHIASSGNLDHNADGLTPAARVKQRGYDYCTVAENIAYEYSSQGPAADALARRFVDGWKDSPHHRENMLDADVVDTGVAVAAGRKPGVYYAVQVFGRPQSARVRFQVTNRSSSTVHYDSANKRIAIQPRQTRTHERCRPGVVKFETAGVANPNLQPQHGGHYAIVRSGAGLRIDQE